ncbi:unnamed protein product [Ixodes hexagonus]
MVHQVGQPKAPAYAQHTCARSSGNASYAAVRVHIQIPA